MNTSSLIATSGITALIAFGAFAFSSAEVDARQKAPRASAPIASTDAPVVLELFTSQGCSSCPPADKLATVLAKDPSLLVISRPVTYWDRLGWKDTLGQQANTDLQRAYARKGYEGAGVYTPQIVVDGRHGAVGSNKRNVLALARDAGMKTKPKLAVQKATNGTVIVTVNGKLPRTAQVSLLALSSHEAVQISRGENGGRTVGYTNVLIDEVNLGKASNAARTITIAPGQMRNRKADRYALIVREATAGPILAGRLL